MKNKLLTVFLGLGLMSQSVLAVTVLGENFAAYANTVVKNGSFATEVGGAGSWSYTDADVNAAITDTNVDTTIIGTTLGGGDYVDLSFSGSVVNGTGNDLKLFFTGNNGHFFDLSIFSGTTSFGTTSYSMPNAAQDNTGTGYTGFNSTMIPSDGIFALAVDLTDFGVLDAGSVDMIRVMIGDGYTTNSAALSFVGAYNVAVVPVPAAVWLFGSGLLGLVGVVRRRK